MAPSLPFYSFIDLEQEFNSSLTDQKLERLSPPPRMLPQDLPDGARYYATKPLPPIPLQPLGNASDMNRNNIIDDRHPEPLPLSVSDSPKLGPRNEMNSFPQILPPPPRPPMSNSERKILQLTGYDPRYDRTTEQHSEFLESSSSAHSSSGSVYSQPESEAKTSVEPIHDKRCSTHSEPVLTTVGTTHLKASAYDSICQYTETYDLITKEKQPQRFEDLQNDLNSTFYAESLTIEDFLRDTKPRNGSESESDKRRIEDPNSQHLVPHPLTFKTKSRNRRASGDKASIFANAKDSMVWGINALTSPAKNITPTLKREHPPILEDDSVQQTTATVIRRQPEHGEAKSTSNLNKSILQSVKSDGKLSEKFSKAMRRLSGGRPPPRPSIISNVARAPGGPDTPAPKSGILLKSPAEAIQFGNDHFQEVYAKAKKSLRIKTAGEKRRETLKRKIVVVGVSDQSPDGRVAEWL